MADITVVGAGLAGSEAAWQLAERGVSVRLVEMRPVKSTPAHSTAGFGELVCSNSLKSLDAASAAGSLKYELAAMGSMIIRKAVACAVPAGKALAVDREAFSAAVTSEISSHPNIDVVREEARELPQGRAIVATGPLTSDSLALRIREAVGRDFLSFYDAAAPIVAADSIDLDKAFPQSRYGKGSPSDYLNAPMDRDEYDAFVEALVAAERVIAKDFERKELFSACQPVEEIARSGPDALRYGPLKPVGLTDPRTGRRPWAVVQLRAERADRSSYNLVGFQTNLRFGEQERVFRMIPGLERAEFARYGVMHRNTFIDSPHALGRGFALPGPDGSRIRFAGQLTGTEGYCEAIASGLYAAIASYADIAGKSMPPIPVHTAFGALVSYATDPRTEGYQPMHVNYGIVEPLGRRIRNKRERYAAYAARARASALSYSQRLRDEGLIPAHIDVSVPDLISGASDEGPASGAGNAKASAPAPTPADASDERPLGNAEDAKGGERI